MCSESFMSFACTLYSLNIHMYTTQINIPAKLLLKSWSQAFLRHIQELVSLSKLEALISDSGTSLHVCFLLHSAVIFALPTGTTVEQNKYGKNAEGKRCSWCLPQPFVEEMYGLRSRSGNVSHSITSVHLAQLPYLFLLLISILTNPPNLAM